MSFFLRKVVNLSNPCIWGKNFLNSLRYMYLFSVLNESFSLSASAMFNFHDLDDTI